MKMKWRLPATIQVQVFDNRNEEVVKSDLSVLTDLNTLKTRSSHRRCSVRKDVLRNFGKFSGKHLCQSLFFNKIAG